MLSKVRRWLREGLVLILLLAVVLFVMDMWRAPKLPASFDNAALQTLDGRSVTLSELSEDRPLLLYFWASWCGVCRYTTPDVAHLAQEGANVMTIGLRSGDDTQLAAWLARKKLELPVINDADGALSRNWQISATPTFVVLDKGQIVSSTTGWTSLWGIKLRLWWASL